MGQHQRFVQGQSLKNSAKSSRKNFALKIFGLGIFCLLSACAGKKPLPQGLGSSGITPPKPLQVSTALGARLTSIGESFSPSLSPNGQTVLFLSVRKETHQQVQVYLYDLENLSERRITYQDGNCDSPIFAKKDDQIVYASTTDEIKERPALLQSLQKKETDKESLPEIPSELYLSDLNGSNIRRLTKHFGFDGDPTDKPNQPTSIYYSQQENGLKEIRQLNLISTQNIPVLTKKGISIENFHASPSGKKWLWLENDPAKNKSSVWLAEKSLTKAQALSLPPGTYQNFFWIDETHLLMSAKMENALFLQIVSYDLDKKCLRPVLTHKSNLTEPQLTKQNSLIFVSDTEGHRQIYDRTVSLDWTSPCREYPVK